MNIAELPQVWIDALPQHGKPATPLTTSVTPAAIHITDRAAAIEQCRSKVATLPPSLDGDGGNACFHACCVIFWGFGLSQEEGRPLLNEYLCASGCKEWSEQDLAHKYDDAMRPEKHEGKTRGWRMREWGRITLYANKNRTPDFPNETLPDWLKNWVELKANNLQTPTALIAMLALGVLSGCLAKRFRVEARCGWQESVNLFVCPLMPPASRKSAILSAAMQPVNKLDAELAKAGDEKRNLVLAERAKIERKIKAVSGRRDKFTSQQKETDTEIDKLQAQLNALPIPPIPRLVVADITEERLAVTLASSGDRIISCHQEASAAFETLIGKYRDGAQTDLYLKGHCLHDSHRVDRQNAASILLSEDFTVTCIFAGQPDALKEKCQKTPHFRNAGLLARFFWVIPESTVGYRQTGIAHVIENKDVDEYYSKAIRGLAEKMQSTGEEPRVLQLNSDARERFDEWEGEIETLLRERGRLGVDNALAEWGGKLAGGTLRIAGILHCADRIENIAEKLPALTGSTETIDRATIERAIIIARHLIAHAEKFFCGVLEGSGGKSDAHHLAKWIVRTRNERFTKSQAHQSNRHRFKSVDEIDLPLAELMRHNCIRTAACEPRVGQTKPPSPEYEVNPAMFFAADETEMGIVVAA